jgi:hypothetical protein
LVKPDGTDLVDIAVINSNYDKIDANIASTKIQATKPASANAGDLWWDSNTGTLYLYYTDANSSQWVAATSDPVNIGVVANQSERDAQYPTPGQGMRVYRTDLGLEQTYYGLFNSSTNPGGRDVAGWYNEQKNHGFVPVRPTSVTAATGSATIDAYGVVTVTGATVIALDGIFSSKFRNYYITSTMQLAGGAVNWGVLNFRAGGATLSPFSYAYAVRRMESSTLVTTDNSSQANALFTVFGDTPGLNTFSMEVHNPNLATPTNWFGDSWTNLNGTWNRAMFGGAFVNSTACDGIVFFPQGSNFTGTIQVFGITDK